MGIRNQLRRGMIQVLSFTRAEKLALRLQEKDVHRGIVVAMHETPELMRAQFERQLRWVSEHFTITSLEKFAELWSTPRYSSSKPPILFTFDDGRESNFNVAAPLLEFYGGRGVFFIVPAFAECAPDDALAFYGANINPNARAGDQYEHWHPMNPAQIAELSRRGHVIGSHTLTHRDLRGLSPDELEREIGDSARKLSSWTNKPIDAFAWAFGWNAFDARAFEIVQHYHRFCFAPCAGLVDSRLDPPALIWRREIEVRYTPAEYRFQYSGLADVWWRRQRQELRAMLTSADNGTANR